MRKSNIETSLKPSTTKHVSKMLAVVAAMLSCAIPPTPVLAKYIELLHIYPPDLIEISGNIVIIEYRWNSFPKVADFIRPIRDDYQTRCRDLQRINRIIQMWTTGFVGTAAPKRGQGPRSLGACLPEMKNAKGRR